MFTNLYFLSCLQLTAKDDVGYCKDNFQDMADDDAALESLGIGHGDIVQCLYEFEREVPSVAAASGMKKPFGAHMTIEGMVAKQTKIERQETPVCSSVSFDMHAANAFQSYIQSAIAFSIKRGGILYGEVDEEKNVMVHAIFEPPQQGDGSHLVLERGSSSEQAADRIAQILGWRKVGWVFAQSTQERDFIFTGEEVLQMAGIQDEMGECSITGVVALFPPEDDESVPEVHFEAFQVSEQCVRLHMEGWFRADSPEAEPSPMLKVRNPKEPKDKTPVIVAKKDVDVVDAELFLVPVSIKDHESMLMTSFPIENRLLPQGPAEVKSHLNRFSSKPYGEKLKDFHLLVYLADKAGFSIEDMDNIVQSVKNGTPLSEGYVMLIDALASI